MRRKQAPIKFLLNCRESLIFTEEDHKKFYNMSIEKLEINHSEEMKKFYEKTKDDIIEEKIIFDNFELKTPILSISKYYYLIILLIDNEVLGEKIKSLFDISDLPKDEITFIDNLINFKLTYNDTLRYKWVNYISYAVFYKITEFNPLKYVYQSIKFKEYDKKTPKSYSDEEFYKNICGSKKTNTYIDYLYNMLK